MKRLRHPIRAIREPFGTAGLIVAMVALIAALGGSAIAAKGGLTGKQKKEVETIAKKYAGKPGASGAQGPAGANGKDGSNGSNGAAGEQGAAGLQGAKGDPGNTGPQGPAGTSVTNTAIAANPGNAHCKEGGAEFKVGSGTPTYACNGEPAAGGGGLPTTLGSGETETGSWMLQIPEGLGLGRSAISFPVPLAADAVFTSVTVVQKGETPSSGPCSGGTSNVPKATSGNLCIYIGNEQGDASIAPLNFGGVGKSGGSAPGFSRTGALLLALRGSGTEEEFLYGTFAVTG